MANSLTKIKTNALADDAVTGAKIADDTVAEANMANDAIGLAEIKAGTDGQILTFDASGNPSYVGPGSDGQVLTSTGAGSPPAFEDAASGVGGATGVDFNDNVKARFGTGNDLEIFHDASHSYVKDNGTGNLRLIGGNVQMLNTAADEYMINAQSDGSVDIFHNGIKQLLTTSDGIEIKPDVEGSNAVLYLTADQGDDNLDKWAIKAASDGTIYHQSYTSGSFVTKFETRAGGDIKVNNGNILMGTAGTGINFSATSDGSGASNVNEVLDDYEEGTFTPTIRANANTNGSQDGTATYVKVGKKVTIHVNIGNKTLTSFPGSGPGTIRIDGLPFVANHTSGDEFGLSSKCIIMGVDNNSNNVYFRTNNGESYLFGYYNQDGSTWAAHDAGHWDNSGVYCIFNMTYFTNS